MSLYVSTISRAVSTELLAMQLFSGTDRYISKY